MSDRIYFERDFAPAEGMVREQERPYRQEICLNGLWDFQPCEVPEGYECGKGAAPELPPPADGKWEKVKIKIPSPWNVNTWGNGRNVGEGTKRPYAPDSVYYPSYPASWDNVEMAWHRRYFTIPGTWDLSHSRVLLYFESVAGFCRVCVNGKSVGEHFEKYLPFSIDITDTVRTDAENELLVGVQNHLLFDEVDPKYPKWQAPYPTGSNTWNLAGIWQDVFLLLLPQASIEDVFLKPYVDRNLLECEAVIRNDGAVRKELEIGGIVREFINLAGEDVLSAPEIRYELGDTALTFPAAHITLEPHSTATVTLSIPVNGRLKYWSLDQPNLYAALLYLKEKGIQCDAKFQRFGWRQYKISGKDLTLNGRKIKLYGDLIHPFGAFIFSRRFAWAWCRMLKDAGANTFRPHAQPYPRYFLDIADEMGLAVLDETAIFGSSIRLNFNEAFWGRFKEHYHNLIKRDRNHPSIFGWSFGNELFAIFLLSKIPPEISAPYYDRLYEIGVTALELDPTRDVVTADGDEDFNGRLPVWSKHVGHGDCSHALRLDVNKPIIVGEQGGTYYARPEQLSVFNGERAYESYEGRNEALAIDLYENIERMAIPYLASFSIAELVWFGLSSIPFGYRDRNRLPNLDDGVFFKNYQEGKPGMQLERIPPFVSTLNPGFDPEWPLYRPLPMFYALKAALEGKPCPYRRREMENRAPANIPPSIHKAGFIGHAGSMFSKRLARLGVNLHRVAGRADCTFDLIFIDGDQLSAEDELLIKTLRNDYHGTLFIAVNDKNSTAGRLFDNRVRFTERRATALEKGNASHPIVSGLGVKDLYFAEEDEKEIACCGMEADTGEDGILLKASRTDWSLFNNRPENEKVPSIQIFEQLEKPSGIVMALLPCGQLTVIFSTVNYRAACAKYDDLWRKLLGAMGIALSEGGSSDEARTDKEHDLLLDGPVDQ